MYLSEGGRREEGTGLEGRGERRAHHCFLVGQDL